MCAPCWILRGVSPSRMNGMKMEWESYGDQSGRGANKRRFLKEESKLAMRQHGQLPFMWRNYAPKQRKLWRWVVRKRVRVGFLRQQEWGWGWCCNVKVKKRVGERLVPLREKRAAAKKTGSRRSINWLLWARRRDDRRERRGAKGRLHRLGV